MKISKYFDSSEVSASVTAFENNIFNIPDSESMERAKILANNCLDTIREYLHIPLYVSSWFRCEELNDKVNGKPTSQHLLGEAVDLKYIGFTFEQFLEVVAVHNIHFDQIIEEHDSERNKWLHISYTKRHINRNEILMDYKK
jgi:hypothetical protein